MKLTDFKTKSAWGIGILAIISLWIAFPVIFKYWVFKLLVTPPFTTEAFASLGPIGDIFGGLTAFFTSLTLIIVLYSAHLQNQANKDARDAMNKQLQQARDATATQLREARRSATEQIKQAKDGLSAQLKQAEESTKQQLALAQASHDAQIKESKYASFSNMFYSLLNHKRDLFADIKFSQIIINESGIAMKSNSLNMLETTRLIAHHFYIDILENETIDISNLSNTALRDGFYSFGAENFNGTINTLLSYFLVYVNIWELTKQADLSDIDRNFFKNILRNSMYQDEQLILFWITPMFAEFQNTLAGSEIFSQFHYQDKMRAYALKYYNESYFVSPYWKEIFEPEETPT